MFLKFVQIVIETTQYLNHLLANQQGHYQLCLLPIDDVLKNNIALSYLLDFMALTDSQAYVFFLLNVEGCFDTFLC